MTGHITTMSPVGSMELFAQCRFVQARPSLCSFNHIGNRRFELAELKLLVDSVQAAKFITEKKSNELIKKIVAPEEVVERARTEVQRLAEQYS